MAERPGERTLVEVLRHEAIQQSDDELAELVDEAADEIERLREALGSVLLDSHWVDSHPGQACKRMLNAVPVSTWERWRAALTARTDQR